MGFQDIVTKAARDYDMDIEQVEGIYMLYPDCFYETLERYIEERKNWNNNKKGDNHETL